MLVRELLIRLGFTTDTKGADKVDKKVNDIRGSADRAASSLFEMAGAFALFAGAMAITRVADEMQSLEARIGQLPQTIGTAGESFDAVAARANNAKQSIEAYASFYIKAGNATQDYIKDQETLMKIVDGAAFGLAASGATAAGQSQAFFQLGQAIASPVVQMEEMNTLIDVAPDLFRALGDAIPGANGNLKKFISTGTVTGKMLSEGLMKVLPQFEKKMKQMPMNVGTATLLIGNKWATFINRMNRESSAITTIANLFLSAFDKIETGLNWVIDKLGGGSNAMRVMAIVLGTILLPVILSATASLWAMIAPVLPLIAAMVLLGLAIEDVYVWVQGGDSVMGDWFGKFESYRSLIDDMKKSFNALGLVIEGVTANLASMVGMLFSAASFDMEGLKNQVNKFNESGNTMAQGVRQLGEVGAANTNRLFGAPTPQSLGGGPMQSFATSYTVNVTAPAGTPKEQALELQRILTTPSVEGKLTRQLAGG